jgi:hypothetical protein
VVATADDGGGMHACVGPTLNSHVDNSAPSSDLMSCISLFNKNYCSNSSADISRPVATVAQYIAMDQALPSLLCNPSSNAIVATGHWPVATLGYGSWLQCLNIVVIQIFA